MRNLFAALLLLACSAVMASDLFIEENRIGDEIPYSLEKLFQDIRQKSSFAADYKQERTIAQLAKPIASSGVFEYRNDVGMKITQKEPVSSITEILPDRIVLTDAQGKSNEIRVQDNMQFQQMALMIGFLFAGNLQPLQAGFEIWYDAESGKQTVGLKPKNLLARQFVQEIVLVFNRQGMTRMTIQESNATTVWQFSGHRALPAKR